MHSGKGLHYQGLHCLNLVCMFLKLYITDILEGLQHYFRVSKSLEYVWGQFANTER